MGVSDLSDLQASDLFYNNQLGFRRRLRFIYTPLSNFSDTQENDPQGHNKIIMGVRYRLQLFLMETENEKLLTYNHFPFYLWVLKPNT